VLPGGVLTLLIIVTVLIVLGMVMNSEQLNIKGSLIVALIAIVGAIAIGIIALNAIFGEVLQNPFTQWLADPAVAGIIIIITVFAAVVLYVTYEPKKDTKEKGLKALHSTIAELFGEKIGK
jgi:hypothetical protein